MGHADDWQEGRSRRSSELPWRGSGGGRYVGEAIQQFAEYGLAVVDGGTLGPVEALTVGALFPVFYSAFWLVRGGRVRDYSGAREAPAATAPPVSADARAAMPAEPGAAPPRSGARDGLTCPRGLT